MNRTAHIYKVSKWFSKNGRTTSRRMRRFFFVSLHPVLRHKEKMCRSARHPFMGAQAEPVLR